MILIEWIFNLALLLLLAVIKCFFSHLHHLLERPERVEYAEKLGHEIIISDPILRNITHRPQVTQLRYWLR